MAANGLELSGRACGEAEEYWRADSAVRSKSAVRSTRGRRDGGWLVAQQEAPVTEWPRLQ